jgi:hypothetical protein
MLRLRRRSIACRHATRREAACQQGMAVATAGRCRTSWRIAQASLIALQMPAPAKPQYAMREAARRWSFDCGKRLQKNKKPAHLNAIALACSGFSVLI